MNIKSIGAFMMSAMASVVFSLNAVTLNVESGQLSKLPGGTSVVTGVSIDASDKQDKLTAGSGITISGGNVISATGKVYRPGDNITIANDVISGTVKPYIAGSNITITDSADNKSKIISSTAGGAEGKMDKFIAGRYLQFSENQSGEKVLNCTYEGGGGGGSGKADRPVDFDPSHAGNLAELTADGNLADSGKNASDFLPASSSFWGSWDVYDGTTFRSDFSVGPNGDLLGITSGHGSLYKFGDKRWYYGESQDPTNEIAVKGDISALASSKADRSELGGYLPLTGGTITGSLQVNYSISAGHNLSSTFFSTEYSTSWGDVVPALYYSRWYYLPNGSEYPKMSDNEIAVKGDLHVFKDEDTGDLFKIKVENGGFNVYSNNVLVGKLQMIPVSTRELEVKKPASTNAIATTVL